MNRYYAVKVQFVFLFNLLFFSTAFGQVFWTETFSSETDFQTNWTNGGTNGGPEEWVWTDNPTAIFETQPDFAATTAADGFIQFNSDGNGENAHDVTITSSAIDCSGQNQVFLSCENQYAFFSQGAISIPEIGVSTNGTDFTYYAVLTAVDNNDLSASVQDIFLELPEAANQSSVFIQFRWRGNFEYVWRIDDISLSGESLQPNNELVLIEPVNPPNFSTPVSQVDSILFGFVVNNDGIDDQVNLEATIDLSGDNGDSFNTSDVTALLEADSSTFILFEDGFLPTDIGNYTISYNVSADATDELPENNAADLTFIVSEDLFSKDDGNIVAATEPNGVNGPWEIGNYYLIEGDGYEAFEVDFSVASSEDTHQGQEVTVFLYRIEEDDNTGDFTEDDVEVVGFATYEFTDEVSFTLVTVELNDLIEGTPGVALEAGVEYLLTVQYQLDMLAPYSLYPYFYDVATVIKDDNDEWFLGGFGPELTVPVRMRIREQGATSTKEPELAENQVQIFPNPASDQIMVNLELETINEWVELEIVDARGVKLFATQLENIRTEQLPVVTSAFPSGNYFLRVRSAEGVKTKRFTIQR